MKHRVRTLIATATAMGALMASTGSASAVSNVPDFDSFIVGPNCENASHYSWSGPDWPNSYSYGDYSGLILYGNKLVGEYCNQSIKYDWATTDSNPDDDEHFYWDYGQQVGDESVAGKTCYVWAYIPSAYATLHNARYDVWGNPTGSVFWADHGHWLFWPGYNVDQYDTTGWIYLGEHAMGSDNTIEVSLSNYDPAGGAAGAGSVAFHCY